MKCFPAAVNSAKMFLILILMLIGATPAFAGGSNCGDFKSCVKAAVDDSVRKCEDEAANASAALSSKPSGSRFTRWEIAVARLNNSKANAKKVYARIDNLEASVDGEFDRVYEELKGMREIDTAHLEQIKKLLARVGQIENVRLPAVEAQAARAEAKADFALSKVGTTQTEIMVFGGTGLSSVETGALIRYGSLSGTGYGWFSSIGFGVGNIQEDPHATSVVTRGGLTTTVGGPSSRLQLDFGATLAFAARNSIAIDGGVVAGGNVGLRYYPQNLGPIVFSAWAEGVWGHFEGKAFFAGIGIDPGRAVEAANK